MADPARQRKAAAKLHDAGSAHTLLAISERWLTAAAAVIIMTKHIVNMSHEQTQAYLNQRYG